MNSLPAQIEREKIRPIPYKFGSRGPAPAEDLLRSAGYMQTNVDKSWQDTQEDSRAKIELGQIATRE